MIVVANDYSYGMVLAKDKDEKEAMLWLIRSVHLYPMNWACWLEMTSLISRVEDVSVVHSYVILTNNEQSSTKSVPTFLGIFFLSYLIYIPLSNSISQLLLYQRR